MSTRPEQRIIDQARAGLDRLVDSIDAPAARALDAARRRAVDSPGRATPAWAWALGATAVLTLAVGIALYGPGDDEQALLAQQPVAEAELYQELEFYLWLSEEFESE